MNIDFSVTQSSDTPGGGGKTQRIAISLQSVRNDILHEIRDIVQEGARRGAERAREIAPRGTTTWNDGRRIRDAIQEHPVRYRPGGAGGGGYYEGGYEASGLIAPQLQYVMEGTADEGRGLIRPSRGNLGVLAIEKEGEGVHFRRWVHGQAPQTTWWDIAENVADRYVQQRIAELRIPQD